MRLSDPIRVTRLLLLPGLILGLAACGTTPFDYRSQNETPEGAGMFTGADGVVSLRSEQAGTDTHTEEAPSVATENDADFRTLSEYQEFLRWRERARGSDEYREFRQWLEWKSFRERERTQQRPD